MDNLDEKISGIMKRVALTVDMQDSVERVAQVMTLHNLVFVPVMNFRTPESKQRCIGMIDANILERFRATQKDPRATLAWQICTVKPLEVGPDMTIIEAANLVVAENNDYLIVHENDAMVGHLTSVDVLKAMMEDGKHRRDDLAQCERAPDVQAQASHKRTPM